MILKILRMKQNEKIRIIRKLELEKDIYKNGI